MLLARALATDGAAASPKLRGNIEKYMRNIDWGMLAKDCKSMFKRTLDVFIVSVR